MRLERTQSVLKMLSLSNTYRRFQSAHHHNPTRLRCCNFATLEKHAKAAARTAHLRYSQCGETLAIMKKFTLDTNCIIDVDLERPSAPAIQTLVQAHRDGRADVAFVAVSASERQPGDYYLPKYDDFTARLTDLGLADIPQILGLMAWDLTYWDKALWGDEETGRRERAIHQMLFPNIDYGWGDFAQAKGVSTEDDTSSAYKKWRNAWCDRQMLWSHDHHKRDVFVTRDSNFKRKVEQSSTEDFAICTPEEAVQKLP